MRELTPQEVDLISGGRVEQCPVPISWTIRRGIDAWFRSWERDF